MSASSKPAAEVVCPTKSGFDKACWRKERAGRPLSPKLMCTWLTHPSAGCAGWHKVGGQEETPSPKPRQESCDSFLQSRKAAKTQQGVTAAQNHRTGLCKIPQPCELVSPLTSRSRANFSEMPGSRSCGLGGKLQMELHSGCTLKLAWDEENSGLNDRACGKS